MPRRSRASSSSAAAAAKSWWRLSTAAASAPAAIDVHLIDISASALDQASRATLAPSSDVRVVAHEATYEAGCEEIRLAPADGRTLLLFLGSNIGNFDPPGADAFLRAIRAALAPGDLLLIGADLVKAERELLLAYDDPLGVTAAFNRNLLVRINDELGRRLRRRSRSATARCGTQNESRVEMHLVSRARQRVRVPGAALDFTMEEGETIWTESSYKYRALPARAPSLASAGFASVRQWVHDRGPVRVDAHAGRGLGARPVRATRAVQLHGV